MKSEKNPITQEAVERWQQGKINIFDEMARLEDDLNELEHYKTKYNNIIEAIQNCHKTKNKYHSQIAWVKLFELAGLPAEYPENYERE